MLTNLHLLSNSVTFWVLVLFCLSVFLHFQETSLHIAPDLYIPHFFSLEKGLFFLKLPIQKILGKISNQSHILTPIALRLRVQVLWLADFIRICLDKSTYPTPSRVL